MCICIITVNERWRLDQSIYTREEPYEVAVFLFKHVYIQLTRPEMHLGLPTNAFLHVVYLKLMYRKLLIDDVTCES